MDSTEPPWFAASTNFFPEEKWVTDDTATWGKGCRIVQPCNVYRCRIGHRVKIGPFVEIQEEALIGDDSVISSHTFIAAGTLIGRRVFVGHHVTFCNDKHPRVNNPNWQCLPPSIGDDVSI